MRKSERRLMTAALLGGMCFLACIFALQGSLLTRMIDHYELTDSLAGIPGAAASAGGFIALFASMLLIGRVSKLNLLKISTGICAGFLILLSLASDFYVFVLAWCVIGIGLGGLDTILSSSMADIYQGQAAKRMMCILHLTYGLSYMLAPVVYSGLLNCFEKEEILWNKVYFCLAVVGLMLLAFLFFTARVVSGNGDSGKADKIENRLSANLITRLIKLEDGFLVKLMLAMFFHGIFLNGLSTWLNRYVGQTLLGEFGDIALTFLYFGLMTSRLVMSFSKISSEKYVSVAGFGAFGVLILAIFIQNPLLMCIAACIGGLFFGAMIPCMLTIGTTGLSDNSFLATTLMMLAFYLGQAVGAPLVGIMESSVNLHFGMGICSLFIALSSLCCKTIKIK